MKQELISVIIPCYNVSKWLDDCFKSLENQTYKNTEFIFVNDGSKDDTLEKLNAFCKGKANCKVIDQKNKGVSVARNSGIAAAKGEWIYFFDPDDIAYPIIIERLYNLAKEYGVDCSMCSDNNVNEDFHFEDLKPLQGDKKVEVFCGTPKILKIYINNFKWGHAVWKRLFKHDLIKQMENYPNVFNKDIKFGEDVDFTFRLFTRVNKVVFTHEKLYQYRQRNNSLMHESFSEEKLESLKSFDNAIECCVGELKSVKHTVILRKFDRYDMFLNRIIKTKYDDVDMIKKVLKGHRQIIPKTYHPILYIVHLYYLIRLSKVLLFKNKKG